MNLESICVSDVIAVQQVLLRDFPRQGNLKDNLVFQINYLIKDNVVSSKLRPEFVTKAVVALEKLVPNAQGRLPFLRNEGEGWSG